MRPYDIALLFALPLAAQTVETPARAVIDPGIVTTRQAISPAGVQAVFQGRVYGLTFGADATEIYVLQSTGIYRMDWKANRVIARVPLRGGKGLQGIRYDVSSGRVLAAYTDAKGFVRLAAIKGDAVPPPGPELGKSIAGAIAANGRIAAVPLIADNRLAIVNLETGELAGKAETGKAPFGVVMDRQGSTAWVSNWGGRVPRPGDLTAPTGLRPDSDRVVVDARGIASTGTLTRIDLKTMAAVANVTVGLHPTAMALDDARGRLYVANTNSDSISVVDTARNALLRTMPVQPFPTKAAGIAPTALALSSDGATLYAGCGGINAVAVIATADGAIRGLIPTAWYPNGLALSADGKWLAVSTLLGAGSGWQGEPGRRYVHANRGSVAVLPVPDVHQLASYTTAVAENNHMTVATAPRSAAAARPTAIPMRSGDPSPIEHVVYIIKENRTYDQVFGDIPRGNGDPKLTMFGETVTPNQHRLANQFVLLDNFYASGGNSGDGHQWVTQANETAYCLWPGYQGRSYPFDGTDPIAYSAGGFLWDAALARKKTVRVFGEYAGRITDSAKARLDLLEAWKRGDDFTSRWQIKAPIDSLNKILAPNFPPYCLGIPDVVRAQIFLADMKKWVAAGSMPNLTIMLLPSNHTLGTSPGASTPRAMVADNDYALGQIVSALTKSPFWKKMAIFVVEDDAQDGVDHVDGHRTVALAISPWVRREHVDSTFYSHQSMVKTIELILGLPTMSIFDLIAHEMRASFTEKPDFTPYEVVEPTHSIYETNPPLNALRGPARRAAQASMKMRWDVPDAVPTERLNRIVWGSIRGWETPYPKPPRAVFAPLALEGDGDDDDR